MPNNKSKPSKKSNAVYSKKWLDSFRLFMTLVKTLVFAICLTLIYALFGDSFDFQQARAIPTISRSNNTQASIQEDDWDKVENGIHLASGLVFADHFELVRGNCTTCHSGKLIAQNRASREGWQQMIRWMQKTQGLWDLGKNEPKILDYLATHYAPKEVGRRANIDVSAIEWYILDLDTNESRK